MKTKSHTTSRIHKFLFSFFFALSSLFFLLCSFFATAQDYEWDWAVSGGGMAGPTGHQTNSEKIYDMKVGSDNNYYFIGTMYGTIGTQLDGEPVTTYNSSVGNNDIFLFSTTCDGQVRWSRAIGGQANDHAYNLVLDSDDNVYIGATVTGSSSFSVYFSPDNSTGTALNRIYLAKYDGSNGDLIEKKALQGNVDSLTREAKISDIVIKNDTLHFIVGLVNGNHLDGNIIVPSEYAYNPATGTYTRQFHLVKYDTDLNYISSMVLPISADSFFPSSTPTRFAYDQTLNRYYLAGSRSGNATAQLIPLTYDGKAFVERSYILAFNATDGSEEWRREVYSLPVTSDNFIAPNIINSLKIDTNSDVYIGGVLWTSSYNETVKIYDPTDSLNTPYTFVPNVYSNMPFVVKFTNNSNGSIQVQWVKTPTAFASNYSTNAWFEPKGLSINENSVVLGSAEAYYQWDNFTQNNPLYYQPDPTLLRFDKQTGATIGFYDIKGSNNPQYMTAVAVDNDGNFVVGGAFSGGLFINSDSTVPPIYSVGQNDFFVARLAATACGTPVVSTKDFNILKLSAYPNPTTAIVNIETDKMLLSYIVYDVSGRQVQRGMFSNNNQINLQNENNGVYFIKITTLLGKNTTLKVIKK